MNELVQDLTSALEESELKIEIDEEIIENNVAKRNKKHRIIRMQKLHETDRKFHGKLWDSHYARTQCKIIEPSCSGSDTESAFALPVIKRHRRRKAKRMETESIDNNFIQKKDIKTKFKSNKDLNVATSNGYHSSSNLVDKLKKKKDEESEISASDESNDDISAQVMI